MTKEEFIKVLDENGIHHIEEGGRLIVGRIPDKGYISFLDLGIDSMPPNVTFENGNLQLGNLKEIPKGVFFDIEGFIYWESGGKISGGTRFGKWVWAFTYGDEVLDFEIKGINYGDLLTATFKYL